MDFSKKNILALTDGSEGMISQVIGLAKHFNNNITPLKTKILFPWSKLQPGILPIFSWIFLNDLKLSKTPDLIISCGRKSVYLSIFLKKKYKNAISIHIQNPKIDFNKFDYIIAPDHDNIKGANIINSLGALHKFNKENIKSEVVDDFNLPKNNLVSVIIGGNNRHYKFSKKEIDSLRIKIQNIKNLNSKYSFLIITSRRTNQNLKNQLKIQLEKIAKVWLDTEKNPYMFSLKYSDFFIVTSDSTSMISECAFTGKPIYVFHLPFKRKSKRLNKFHHQFEKLNITKELQDHSNLQIWQYDNLNESERIASIIKKRIIKENV